MSRPLIFALFREDDLAANIQKELRTEGGALTHRYFPDGESYIRFDSNVRGRDVIIVTDLANPDAKLLPLIFAATAAKNLGASLVGLIAPYLPYMRQDKTFIQGEAITPPIFANVLSRAFDWMVTIDPHLHRISTLTDIYTLEAITLSANALLVEWIDKNVDAPLIIGPDAESEQWASAAAKSLDCPYIIAAKERCGDRCVDIVLPKANGYTGHSPIIIDDVISTGTTVMELTSILKRDGFLAPVCLAVHALFSPDAGQRILDAGVEKIITTNTIGHGSNDINVGPLIAQTLRDYLNL